MTVREGQDPVQVDVAIIGGGFYGCCLALFMRSVFSKVVILERSDELMTRASAVNQARVHNGFHYPRSFVTALRSVRNFPRFVELFDEAIVDDFEMLYAISRSGSKVSANRFLRMSAAMGAPIATASPRQQALFDSRMIEHVFSCREYAFDWIRLRALLLKRLARADVEIRYGTEATAIVDVPGGQAAAIGVRTTEGGEIVAGSVFNATYSQINPLLVSSGLEPLPLKHEWAEVALVDPPADLRGVGVTVMDGPFFSAMPYPTAQSYSLTHVRYTPHLTWTDGETTPPASLLHDQLPRVSRWYHMVADARRFLPCLQEATWRKSLFEVKTVLTRNESDDGRPIMFHRHDTQGCFYSVLGAKIDNVFDLFAAVAAAEPKWRDAHMAFLQEG